MAKRSNRFNRDEFGPWLGMYDWALENIPPGGSPKQENMRNTPGNPGTFSTRNGMKLWVNNDRLPVDPYDSTRDSYSIDDHVWAYGRVYRCTEGFNTSAVVLWVASTVYSTGNLVLYRANDPLGPNEGGLVWKRTATAGTPGTSFLAEITNGMWDPIWEEEPLMGTLVSDTFGGAPGQIIHVMRSGQPLGEEGDPYASGETVHLTHARLRSLVSLPGGFLPPIETPSPGAFGDASYAFLATWDDTASSALTCVLLGVNVNLRSDPGGSTPLGNLITQAVTAGRNHRPWLVKATDNTVRWLFWRSVMGEAGNPTEAEKTWFGTWDAATLVEGSWTPNNLLIGGGRSNDWRRSFVPRFLTVASNGDFILLGDNEFDGEARVDGQIHEIPGEPIQARDVCWKFRTVPTDLWVGDARRHAGPDDDTDPNDFFGGMRYDWRPEESGAPNLIALPGRRFIISTIGEYDPANNPDTTMLGVRSFQWDSQLPNPVGDAYFTETTLGATAGTTESARINSFRPFQIALLPNETVALALGTADPSIAIGQFADPAQSRGQYFVSADDIENENVVGVLGSFLSPRLFAITETDLGNGAVELRVHVMTTQGLPTGTVYDQNTHANLGFSSGTETTLFRGAFFDEREEMLWIVVWIAAETVSDGLKFVGIPHGVDEWVGPGELYFQGDIVQESGTVYRANETMTSSALFATDAAKWTALTTEFSLDLTSISLARAQNVWAFPDSHGSVFRNAVVGAVLS